MQLSPDQFRQPERALTDAELTAASHAFLIASARAAIGLSRQGELEKIAAGGIDPNALLRLARNHRVLPMVHRAIRTAGISLPPDVSDALASDARSARVATFANTGEEVRLACAAQAAGLDAIFIKGATLSHLLYADPSLKSSWDIDMLVARADMWRACALLQEHGFVIEDPHGLGPSSKRDRWIEILRESVWHHPQRDTTVELHVGLSETAALLADVGMGSPRQTVPIAGIPVSTLADEQLFTYLCVHGTGHGWARLKWLIDAAAMICKGSHSPAQWRKIAAANGAGRCGDVMLWLSHEVLGVAIPAALLADIRGDPVTGDIVDYCHAQMNRLGIKGGSAGSKTIGEMIGFARNLLRCSIGPVGFIRTAWDLWNRPYGGGMLWLPRALRPVVKIVWLPWRTMRRIVRQHLKL